MMGLVPLYCMKRHGEVHCLFMSVHSGEAMWGHRRWPGSASRKRAPSGIKSARTLILEFPDSKSVRTNFGCLSHPASSILLGQPAQTDTHVYSVFFNKSLAFSGLHFPYISSERPVPKKITATPSSSKCDMTTIQWGKRLKNQSSFPDCLWPLTKGVWWQVVPKAQEAAPEEGEKGKSGISTPSMCTWKLWVPDGKQASKVSDLCEAIHHLA